MATIADLVIRLSANTAAAEKDISSFSGKVSKGFGKALLPAVGILGGLGVAAKKTTDAATKLGESQNAVNVVFGEAGKKIAAFAQVADKKAGLSISDLNSLVVPLGASFTNLGDSQDVAAKKSINLAKRAADMASVFNVSVPEALQAIQSGLRGEADPLEKFGVGLNDAAVSAYALEHGLAKTKAELTAADKAQARYGLILEQTNKFQGDFANTSDSAANAARINAAAQENLSAKIGTGLLPVVQKLHQIVGAVTGFMAEHTNVVMIVAGVLGGLAVTVITVNAAMALYTAGTKIAAAATKIWTAAQKLLNLALRANPIGIVITALVLLGTALVVAYQKSETFRGIVTGAFNAIKTAANAVLSFFRDHWKTIAVLISGPFAPIVLLATNAFGVRDALTGAFKSMLKAAKTLGSALASAFDVVKSAADLVAGVLDRILGLAGKVGDALGKVTGAASKVGSVIGKIPGLAGGTRNFGGGLAVVGERGPELVNLPRGSDVFSTGDSAAMLGAGRTLTVNINGAQVQPLDEGRLMDLLRRAEALA